VLLIDFNLASVQAGDSILYIKRFNSIVRQLYDYFQNSAVRMAELKAIQTLIHEKGKLCAPSTRWLSMEQSVKRLKEYFCSVVMSLQREGEERGVAKALGLHKLMTEYRFVCTLLLMCDVLSHISHLSKCFQITDCDYSIINVELLHVCNCLCVCVCVCVCVCYIYNIKNCEWHKQL